MGDKRHYHRQYFLKPELMGFLVEALDYYKLEYQSIKARERTAYLGTLKYFVALCDAYAGKSLEELASEYEVTAGTIKGQLMKTQGKVETYIKLKRMGKL